ncbi:CRISPR-associated endonuclease Cas2 [bacterium]|nr:CRISPR-associated endonuclease Cas2 [bacterium]
MGCYIVSYDLRNQKNYEKLHKALKSYGTGAHILESTWAIVTTKSAKEIRGHLKGHMDSDDGLFVLKSGGEGALFNVDCNSNWLKENL